MIDEQERRETTEADKQYSEVGKTHTEAERQHNVTIDRPNRLGPSVGKRPNSGGPKRRPSNSLALLWSS